MNSSYTGIYVQKDSNGKIHSVQVYDTVGNSIPLDVEIYIEREIKPDVESLPTEEEYNSSK